MSKILIVEDSEINREMLKAIFEDEWDIVEAVDGEQAIEVIEQFKDELKLIFLDLVMPVMDGLGVLKYMRSVDLIERIPVIMITGEATVESDAKAYEYGAADIVYKPFAREVITRRANNLIALYEKQSEIEQKLEDRTRKLKESQELIAKNNKFLINALGSVVEFRSLESGEHVQRVTGLTKIMLTRLNALYPEYGFTKDQIEMMSQAAALHDVGKIGIPDDILHKPGRLTAEEFDTMKTHTTVGCEVLEKFKQDDNEFYQYCYDICRWHHEKYDGKGYPDGLKGDEIPVWAQVVAVADCFDALCSKRSYKKEFDVNTAYNMIQNGECGQFSDKMLECFTSAKREMFDQVSA